MPLFLVLLLKTSRNSPYVRTNYKCASSVRSVRSVRKRIFSSPVFDAALHSMTIRNLKEDPESRGWSLYVKRATTVNALASSNVPLYSSFNAFFSLFVSFSSFSSPSSSPSSSYSSSSSSSSSSFTFNFFRVPIPAASKHFILPHPEDLRSWHSLIFYRSLRNIWIIL
jgi:hypothetical protein